MFAKCCFSGGVEPIRAVVDVVIDSCHNCEELKFDVELPCIAGMTDELKIGSIIPIRIDEEVVVQEVSRQPLGDDCYACTVLWRFPIVLNIGGNCVDRVLNTVRSVTLRATCDSCLDNANTCITAVNCVVTEIEHDRVVLTCIITADLHNQQVAQREVCLANAEPVLNDRVCTNGGCRCSQRNRNRI
ncbi:MAG: hypothetical protein LBB91_04220 [Clostridiales bacterium]|jgi:hypothetical protein|nr:hypothetical protein [Clostridiales bacterium]